MKQTTANTIPISALVARYGVAAPSLRNWEQQGLIPPAARTPGGHRRYNAEHIATLDRLFNIQRVTTATTPSSSR